MVEPYDLKEIDNFATIEEFAEPLIDKYSQTYSSASNFGINISNKTYNYPIFIFFNGHIKFIETNSFFINSELKNEIDEKGFKELEINNPFIKIIPNLNNYINLYIQSDIIPNKVIISKSISFNFENYFSEIINENGFINNSIDILTLINDLNILEKTHIFKKYNSNSFSFERNLNEIKHAIIYNKEFRYSFIYKNEDNKKLDIGRWNELEVVYSSDKPIISNKVFEQYDRKFWNKFLLSYHSAILEEIETNENDKISFKSNLDTIIRNMFITEKEINLKNENRCYFIEEIFYRIRDRLDNDYGFSTYFIIKLIEEYLIDFKQSDGSYRGIIDRYDYQINNNLEADYEERSKLYILKDNLEN